MRITEQLYIEEFPSGAEVAAVRHGLNIVIDTIRASNTILALLKFTDRVIPVKTVEEAMTLNADVRVGEVDGVKPAMFDYDNSPVTIERIGEQLRGKSVVLRTTNGTQGLLASQRAQQVIVASPRNLSAVVNHSLSTLDNGLDVSIVAMGTLRNGSRVRSPEDQLTAELIASKILDGIGYRYDGELFSSVENFETTVRKQLSSPRLQRIQQDIPYCLDIDRTEILPEYSNGMLGTLH